MPHRPSEHFIVVIVLTLTCATKAAPTLHIGAGELLRG